MQIVTLSLTLAQALDTLTAVKSHASDVAAHRRQCLHANEHEAADQIGLHLDSLAAISLHLQHQLEAAGVVNPAGQTTR